MYIGEAVFSNMTWVQTTMSTAAACVGDCWEIICKERDTLSEAVVSLTSVVTFVTWLILEQNFLVQNLFYNDIFLDVLFMRLDCERRLSRCLPNLSTFVPNDRSQCLYYVLPIMRCAFGAYLDVGLAERRTPCKFVGNLTFPSLFLGEDGHRWKDGIAQGHMPRVQSRFNLLQPCTALSTTSHLMESANPFFFNFVSYHFFWMVILVDDLNLSAPLLMLQWFFWWSSVCRRSSAVMDHQIPAQWLCVCFKPVFKLLCVVRCMLVCLRLVLVSLPGSIFPCDEIINR